MAHDSHDTHDLPIIPFTAPETTTLRADDVKAAKTIGGLAGGIFLVGFVLYVTVLISVIVVSPIYSVR